MTLQEKIFTVRDSNFEETALEVFNEQYSHVELYRAFCDTLSIDPLTVQKISDIPFLPIAFFKTHLIIYKGKTAAEIFESSGTTGTTSKHHVADLKLYEECFTKIFEQINGPVSDYVMLALLPSYLERKNSSLVYMVESLIRSSGKTESGFFLNELDKLHQILMSLNERKQKTILLGVSFALLDFAEKYSLNFPDLIIMETGGMKGRREELTREELHQQLCKSFGVQKIHSEYGMTELLSQAYSSGDGIFRCPPWMKIIARDIYDPLELNSQDEIAATRGAANIIDLANLYSCSFIATNDLVKVYQDGIFEILGRMDNADLRGCNLMI